MGYLVEQNNSTVPIVFGPVVLSSDHISAATGKTLTVTISKAGASFAAPAGAVTEIGNGYYQIAANSTDAASLGPLVVNATCTGCDPFDDAYLVVAYNPFDNVHLGLTALPNAAAAAAGGLVTVGTGAGQLNPASGDVTVGSYASGQDPGSYVLATPANKLATNASGQVVASNTLEIAGVTAAFDGSGNLKADVEDWKGAAAPAFPANFAALLISSGGDVQLDLTEALNTSNTGDTVGGALIGARSEAFGKWVASGASLTLYAADGTTALRTFTVSPTPTAGSRT